MQTGKPPHLRHFDYTGFHRYFLTFCTAERQHLFKDRSAVDLVQSQISRASNESGFEIPAYCFMPDHLHLLVHGLSEASDCKRFITLAKQYSGYYYSKEFGRKLWQRYSYERTLRKDEDTLEVARYIIENPVRAKLVMKVEDYPFVGSLVCSLNDLLASLPPKSGGHYVRSRSG